MLKMGISSFSERRIVAVIFLLALLARVLFLAGFGAQKYLEQRYYENDAATYIRMANTIKAHERLTEGKLIGLGYPLMLSGIFTVFGECLVAVRFIQALLGALSCVFIYWLGKELFGRTIGIISGLLLALDPFYIYQSGAILTEASYIFLLVTSLWLMHKGVLLKKIPVFILGNLFLCLAGFWRAAAFALYPFVFIWLFLLFRKEKKVFLGFLTALSGFLFIIVITAALIVAKSYAPKPKEQCAANVSFVERISVYAASHFVITSSSENLGIEATEFHLWRQNMYKTLGDLNSFEAKRTLARSFYEFARANPKLILKIVYEKFINFWRIYPHANEPGKPQSEFGTLKYKMVSLLTYGLLLPFFILGLIVAARQWRKAFLLYSLIFLFVCIHSIHASQIRYRLQIVPSFVIFASCGMLWFVRRVRGVK